MLLQSLCKYYDDLVRNKVYIAPRGYSDSKISYALTISKEGELKYITTKKVKGEKGNKSFPVSITLPFQEKRSSGIFPYFLSDNSKYVFGLVKDKKNPIEITEKHFEAFKKYNLEILKNVDNDEANAIVNFLNKWDVQKAEEILVSLRDYDEDIFDNSNFIFILDDKNEYIHNNAEIKEAWLSYSEKNIKGEKGQCLVTGKETTLALLHGNLKGVRDAQPAGAAIVSFNIPSFISYEKSQSYNAPVGIDSEFKYVTVLNHMLKNGSEQKIQIGDATTVFWAEKVSDNKCNDLFSYFLNSSIIADDKKTENEKIRGIYIESTIKNIIESVNQGKKITDKSGEIDFATNFYVLGLSPNNARISIRFFHTNTVESFMYNLAQHHIDIGLEGKPKHLEHVNYIPIWLILDEIIPKNSKNKKHNALLTGKIMNSILTGSNYPDIFLTSILSRIRAEQDINHLKVSIIKAYLSRKIRNELKRETNPLVKKELKEQEEVLLVSLNEDTTDTTNPAKIAYRLGRLFSLLEKAQRSALGELNSTIKDKYFATASVTPRTVFPVLMRLNLHHLAKLESGAEIDISKVLFGIQDFPVRLNLEEQGVFTLGYYHQRQNDINAAMKSKAEKEARALAKKEDKSV